jgi:hypothetical protein
VRVVVVVACINKRFVTHSYTPKVMAGMTEGMEGMEEAHVAGPHPLSMLEVRSRITCADGRVMGSLLEISRSSLRPGTTLSKPSPTRTPH